VKVIFAAVLALGILLPASLAAFIEDAETFLFVGLRIVAVLVALVAAGLALLGISPLVGFGNIGNVRIRGM
jgi:hypothetical protein